MDSNIVGTDSNILECRLSKIAMGLSVSRVDSNIEHWLLDEIKCIASGFDRASIIETSNEIKCVESTDTLERRLFKL